VSAELAVLVYVIWMAGPRLVVTCDGVPGVNVLVLRPLVGACPTVRVGALDRMPKTPLGLDTLTRSTV
jgi:hypothetical protein